MAERNALYDPFGNPAPEVRSYQPAWHDRVVNYLTNAVYGENANAQQRERVNMLAGPDNPFNIPAQVNQGYNTLAQGVALRDPAQAGIGVAQMAMSLPFGIGKAPAQAATKGIRAYHGSPHDFDRFSLDKIGTGEGAQAYGHGLYFAESEPVAQSYKNVHKKQAGWTSTDNSFEALPDGRMYEVNIKADPNDFLDWDKPLSQQSEKVQSLLSDVPDNLKGAEAWDALMRGYIHDKAAPTKGVEAMPRVSQDLREAGIPGIKYLDQGSRTAGEGSRNYVVFDDALIEILRKYGLAGLMAGGAAATASTPADAKQ